MSRRLRLFSLATLLLTTSLAAAGPLDSLIPFRSKVEADPKKNYQLTKNNGPWMIMAISLAGDDAEANAQRIALELRRDFKVEAWIHEQEVDRGESVIGKGVDKYGKPRKMKNMRGGATSEVAVMVGNYKSADDPQAQRTLDMLRTAKIKALSNVKATEKSQFNAFRNFYLMQSRQEKAKEKGLLGRAFMTRNPLLPVEEVAESTLDPFVLELNRGVEYSLLDNPKQYTVVVGTFRGASAYSEEKFVESIKKQEKKSSVSPIDKAAIDASLLAAKLREEGWEAYVFHDRYESLVTVGSFDEIGTEMPDGHTELNSGPAKIVRTFEGQKKPLAAGPAAVQPVSAQVALVPVTRKVTYDGRSYDVPLDLSPRPIYVPRQSIADVYRER